VVALQQLVWPPVAPQHHRRHLASSEQRPPFATGRTANQEQDLRSALPTRHEFQRLTTALRRLNAPGRNRTCDLALRRRTLYPLSYRRRDQGSLASVGAEASAGGGDLRCAPSVHV